MQSKEENKLHIESLIETIDYSGNPKMTNTEKAKMKIFAKCIEDLEYSIDRNSKSSQSLATKVYYLNWVLVAATVIGTVIAVFKFFNCPS